MLSKINVLVLSFIWTFVDVNVHEDLSFHY